MSPQVPARNVLVVIGTGGMGLAVARRLAAGRRVLLADWSAPGLEATVGTLRGEGHEVEGHTVDVTQRDSVESLAVAAGAAGRVDAVVHTAGVSPVMATARQIYEVDLLGTAHVIDAFLPVASAGTSLVCVASMAGHFASLSADLERHLATAPTDELLEHKEFDLESEPALAYVVAKRANQLRVQASAHAWGAKGARLNTISPGVISTPMGAQELQGPAGVHIQAMLDLSGARRAGTPDDIASAAAFLTGPDSAFITGNDLLVDGGTVSAQRWNTTPAA
ncbi:SDR family oxidoreductase [Streptomyces sp. NBC_00554]|uniref:SDR family oxidoreductase n=1 Tax=Streptomyces sp. NBC_00554 TaxID=2903661 RepID=UPI00352E6656|nr:SDR family oxidoreductase [Streptomyces sp. NBC_00554]